MRTNFIIVAKGSCMRTNVNFHWTKITLAFQYINLHYSLYFNPCVLTLLLFHFIALSSPAFEEGTIIFHLLIILHNYCKRRLRTNMNFHWTKITLAFQYIHLYYSLYFNACMLKLLLFLFYSIYRSRQVVKR